jgi:uncharacterized membrane protein
MDTLFTETLHWITRGLELVGVAAIVIGTLWATVTYIARRRVAVDGEDLYRAYRTDIGKAILLGLEFLVAADIINTVAIDLTLESVAALGAIVLIRTFLSFSLEVEIDGRLPWRSRRESASKRIQ